jgi:subtilase family serine protease
MIGNKELSEANVKAGDTVQISVLVTNVGNLDYNNETSEEKVVIRFMEGSNYLGEVDLAYLPSQTTGDKNSIWVSHPWNVGKARDYKIKVILDPYDSFPESSEKNNEFIGEVKVEPPSKEIVDEDDKDLESPNLSTIGVMIFIFLLLFNIIIWMMLLRAKHSNKKK